VGSHARVAAGLYSDIDLLRLVEAGAQPPRPDGTALEDGWLVNVSSITPPQIEECFTRPEVAVNVIGGLRTARPLLDGQGAFAALIARAHAFRWDDAMQREGNRWTSRQVVGWIEEVHKGLEGLRRNDTGRMLNARFGFSWGMARVMVVHHGLLLAGDNDFYDAVLAAAGAGSAWARLAPTAFGIETPGAPAPLLREQIEAGLRLYVETARLLRASIEPGKAEMVAETVQRIEEWFGQQ
jgi:hypothetical protein